MIAGFILIGLTVLSYLTWDTYQKTQAPPPNGQSVLQYWGDSLVWDSSPPPLSPLSYSSSWDMLEALAPDRTYRPWVRWNWASLGDQPQKLRSALQRWDSLQFGGIQLYTERAAGDRSSDTLNATTSGRLLRWILFQADQHQQTVSLEPGSGSPIGGNHIQLADNVQSLYFAETHILGGKRVRLPVPELSTPASYYQLAWEESEPPIPAHSQVDFYPDSAKLLCLIAAKPRKGKRNFNPFVLNDQVQLDVDSIFLITDQIEPQNQINWEAPKGYWKLIAVYAGPTGERARKQLDFLQGLTLTPLDSQRLISHYQYLFRPETALSEQFGQPVRFLAQGQPFFQAECLFSPLVLSHFKQHRGYALTPYLPVLSVPGKHHRFFERQHLARKAAYQLTQEDERIRFDYNRTIAELYEQQSLGAGARWAAQQGLHLQSQPFGLPLDVIKAVSHIPLPEIDFRYAGGTSLFTKLIVSGAHHYQKPLISAQFLHQELTPWDHTPQKWKLAADKLFSQGVNHLVSNGALYQEDHAFAKHWKSFHEYLSRCQYWLRKGRPEAEVLIYYPFLGFPASFADQSSHEELYFRGQLPGWDAPSPTNQLPEQPIVPHQQWYEETFALVEALEAAGITWEWINEDLLLQTRMEGPAWQLQGRRFRALILPRVTAISLPLAHHLASEAQKGSPLLIYGQVPDRQPGFWKHQEHDPQIASLMQGVAQAKLPQSPAELINRLQEFPSQNPYRYETAYPFLRHHHRRLTNGDRVIFFHNQEAEGRYFRFQIPDTVQHLYWINPLDKKVVSATRGMVPNILGYLEGFGSTFLLCTQTPLADSLVSLAVSLPQTLAQSRNRLEHPLQDWTLQIQSTEGKVVQYQDSIWFDWREVPTLAHANQEGVYTGRFYIQDTLEAIRYMLDLDQVYHTADIYLNTQPIGQLAYLPYALDISPWIQPGWNQVEIWLTPTPYNATLYQVHKGKLSLPALAQRPIDKLQPAGLLGPVKLWEVIPPKNSRPVP